jgi:gluconate 2-dehydrogenase gamma chain
MRHISRRTALQLILGGPTSAALVWTPAEARAALERSGRSAEAFALQAGASTAFTPRFFTAHEYSTVTILADLIVPRDERSGSASDAGVPQFMDFMMIDQPRRQVAMRGGLALIDRLTRQRAGKRFTDATDAQRRRVLDEIAYTSNPDPSLAHAVAFFSSFRDLTASGFWSSRMGVADLSYEGNTFVAEWNGCPDEALRKLGVK